MEYIFKQKFIDSSLALQDVYKKVVLVVDPSPEACAIYAKHFSASDFIAQICYEYQDLSMQLKELEPHLLVLNVIPIQKKMVSIISDIVSKQPMISIITLAEEGFESEPHLLLELGVAGHINKTLTRPRDVVVLAKHVLSL